MITRVYVAQCDACGKETIVRTAKLNDVAMMLRLRGWRCILGGQPRRKVDYCPTCIEAIRLRVKESKSGAWYGE